MAVKPLASQARVVVIGGGIMGCAMLYELTRQGCSDVVLLEKGELTSGSTWHAAGQVPHYSDHPLFARIQYESFESYKQLETDAGEPTGVKAVGSLRLARTKDEVLEYRRFLSIAKRIGIEAEFIGPNETCSLWPLLQLKNFEGALHTFHDGYTDPAQTTNAFANAARKHGADIARHTRVTGITRSPSHEWRIDTNRGTITAEIIVNAAGFWGSEISAMIGGSLPILAMEHEYLVTEPDTEISTSTQELPVFRDLNVPTYLREEQGGLLVACYEDEPVFWGLDGIPKEFGQELFAPDLERAAPNLAMTMQMVPILNRLGIKSVVNGPTGRTADLKPCVGPAHGARGYYTLCGAVGGFLQSGFSRYLAEWILEGEPSIDLSPVDVRRFGDYATQAYAVAKVSVGHAYANPVVYPYTQPTQGRHARCSALYGVLKSKSACFGVENGWEVPNWFAPQGIETTESPSFSRQSWVEHAAAEARSTVTSSGVLDLSSRLKFEVRGKDAEKFLSRLCANPLPMNGTCTTGMFLTSKGQIVAVLMVARHGEVFTLTGESAFELYIRDWLINHRGDDEVTVSNTSSRDALLWLGGAHATKLLADTGVRGVSSLQPGSYQKVTIGHSSAWVARTDDVVAPAYEIVHPAESQIAIYETLMSAGVDHGLVDLGRRGYESLRLSAGRCLWGTDIDTTTLPVEAHLDKLVSASAEEFIGNAAARTSSARRLVHLEIEPVDHATTDPWGSEPVFAGEREVGFVTSGGFAADLKSSLAMAYVSCEYCDVGTRLAVEILNQRRPAIVIGGGGLDPVSV